MARFYAHSRGSGAHSNQPDAVVPNLERYEELARMAHREKVREAHQFAGLRARFDQRLASRNAPSVHQALNAFMDEPFELSARSRREDDA